MPSKDFLADAKPAAPGASGGDFLDGAKPVGTPAPDFLSAQPPATGGTVSAAPVEPWLTQLEHDMSEGGTRTLPGRILGRMQGRGEQGFSGFGEGPEGSGNILASPEMGAIHTAQGITEIPHHPLSGLLHTAEGALQTAQLPTSFVAPEAAGTGTEIPTVLGIPNRGHASRIFQSIGEQAQNLPVSMRETQPALDEFGQHVATGGKPSNTVNLLNERLDSSPRVEFPEARKFYTNISDETKSPSVFAKYMDQDAARNARFRANLGPVGAGLNSDLTSAASSIGRGDDYANAMKEYRQGAQLNRAVKVGAGVLAGEGIRRSGLLGKVGSKILGATP